MKMITKKSDLRRHLKNSRFVEPNAEVMHIIGVSANASVFSPTKVGLTKRLQGIKKFPINWSTFDFF